MNHDKPNQSDAVLGIWDVLRRYRWRFIVPAFLVSAGVLAASLVLPRKYNAEAIFERKTDMVLAEITNYGVPRTFTDPRESVIKEVAGEPALEQLVTQLVPDDTSPDARVVELARQKLRQDLTRKVQVGFDISSNDLDRIRVQYVHNDSELARQAVNQLIENYITRTRRQMDDRLRQSAAFFRQEVESIQGRIVKLENDLLAYEIDHAALLPDAPGGVQDAVSLVQEQLGMIQLKRESTALRVEALSRALQETPKTRPSLVHGRNPDRDLLQSDLRRLKTKLSEYVSQYKMTDKHPDLRALRDEIAKTEKRIAAAPLEVVTQKRVEDNPKFDELELQLTHARADLAALVKQETKLGEQAHKLDQQASKLFAVRSEYRKLSRQVEESQRQMTFWEDNQRRVEMALAAESGDRGIILDFIKPAGVIHKPISPNLMQVLMAAVALGVVSGAVCVFFAYRTDETVGNPQDLAESLDLQLFGTVSEIISRKQRWVRRMKQTFLYPINGAAMASVLLIMAGLLYLNLEEPYLFQRLTGQDDGAPSPQQTEPSEQKPQTKTEPAEPKGQAAVENQDVRPAL